MCRVCVGVWESGGAHQGLLDQQAEQDGVAHLPQALEHVCLQLSVFDDVLQLVVEELQDTCTGETGLFTSLSFSHFLLIHLIPSLPLFLPPSPCLEQ